jgi:hypothetical protein
VGSLLVKGKQLAREAVADNQATSTQIVAIPCLNADQAGALMRELGEPDRSH